MQQHNLSKLPRRLGLPNPGVADKTADVRMHGSMEVHYDKAAHVADL